MLIEVLAAIFIFGLIFYGFLKPLPAGLRLRTKKHLLPESKVEFFYDLSWFEQGKRQSEQHIFKAIKETLANAERFFVMDMFLFNTNQSNAHKFLPITRELCDLLIKKKAQNKDFIVYMILDPFNTFYKSYVPELYKKMNKAGIRIIETDIDQLRDRNYLYSAIWRFVFYWLEKLKLEPNWIQDPTSRKKRFISLHSILRAMNARANHRKVVVADHGSDVCAIVSSANVHEASSWFTNAAFKVYGAPAFECLQSEESVARFSGEEMQVFTGFNFKHQGQIGIQVLTEDTIEDPLISDIENTQPGEQITIVMLFLEDFDIIKALMRASRRGVRVRLVLDRNSHSFEQKKMGLPNHVTGWYLHERTAGKATIRWWKNKKDQLHTKMMAIEKENELIVYNGSANYTVRNIEGYSLENSLRLEMPKQLKLAQEIVVFTDRIFDEKLSDPITGYPKNRLFFLKRLFFLIQRITGFTTC